MTAENEQTGGMIALIPDNPGRYTVPGGDPAGEMHCTLCFLGDDVADLPPVMVDTLKSQVAALALNRGPLSVRILGTAIWNRDGGPTGAFKPATVTALQPGDHDGDEDDQLDMLASRAAGLAADALGALYPEQHEPYLPHITAGFDLDPGVLPTADGEASFSTIRLALGGQHFDFPLIASDDHDSVYATEGVTEMAEATKDREAATQGLPAFWPCLAVEGMETADGRYLEPGTIEFRKPPLSVFAQTVNTGNGGHSGAEVVGKINELWKIPGEEFVSKQTGEPLPKGTFVWQGRGEVDGDSKGGDYARRGYLTGNSVDLSEGDFTDDVTYAEDGTESHRVTVSNAKIAATTLCAIPAFPDGYVEIDGERPTIAADDEVPEDQRTPEGLAAYLLQHGVQAVTASIAIPEYGDTCSPCLAGEMALPPAFLKNAKKKKDDPEDAADGGADEADENADGTKKKAKPAFLKKKGLADLPPLDWFTDPGLSEPTPLTFTDDGRVFGHIATWNTCHIGVSKRCTPPPKSASDYAYFNTGAMRVADGDEVRTVGVGHLTMNTGHASLSASVDETTSHYDNTGTVAADLAAGEDRHGIWVAGRVRPELSEVDLTKLMAAPPSGDWRGVGGRLEMVGVLAVNVPGYPVPRARVASGVGQVALVAAGATRPAAEFGPDGMDLKAFAKMVAAELSNLLGDWARTPEDAPDKLAAEQEALSLEIIQGGLLDEVVRPFPPASSGTAG